MARSKPKPNIKAIEYPSPADIEGKAQAIGGSKSDNFNNSLFMQVLECLSLANSDAGGRDTKIRMAIAAMIGIHPGDEIEGMIAAQMVATHNAAMECFRRAMVEDQTFEWRRENLNQANKLGRSYAALLEALNRHRGKGQQQVTVKHVHVNQGGQAIVGAIGQRPGVLNADEEQSGGQRSITHQPSVAMRCTNPQRQPVPVAGGSREDPL